MQKQLLIVGGANGTGKTTFAYQYRDESGIDYLGADEIADSLPQSGGARSTAVAAGRLFFRRLEEYLRNDRSVIIESTLSGLGLAQRLPLFREQGYEIRMVYVFLKHADACKRRIRIRVHKGGHAVPSADVERRFSRSLRNFGRVYQPLADRWQILYNGLKRPVEVAYGEEGQTVVVDEEYYRTFLEISQ